MKIKKGDNVIVIAGKERGKTGTVARVLPREERILIDGLNLVKRHRRATGRTRKGQIVDRAMPMHISNVMLVDPKSGKPTRIRITRDEKGERGRVAIKSGETLK